MIKAIIFDFDGVIHNTFPLHLRNLNKFVKNGDLSAEEYRALHDGNIHVVKKSMEKIKDINFFHYQDFIKNKFTAQKITADIGAALQKLSQDYKLFIISSGGEKNINGFLINNNVRNLFLEVMGQETDDSKEKKFQMIMDNYKLAKNEIVFITDTLGDIIEANNAGLKTIAIDTGFHDRERLTKGNPFAVISGLEEVINIIMPENKSRAGKQSPIGSYKMEIISLPEECDSEKYLPLEIRYIFKKQPEYKNRMRKILEGGHAIGVRTVLRTPQNILKAVHTISVHSQRNYIINWLPELLKNKHRPKLTEKDYRAAQAHGENLDEAVKIILKDRLRFKTIVLIDEENIGIKPEEQRFITELSEIIYPIAVDYSVFRVIADNAQERTKIAQAIIKALLFIGPTAHFLEKFASGWGKVFAASADDLLGESAELAALRGSGFAWRELARRGRILAPVFILATYGAFSVEGLIQANRLILAGIVFGLSAVALSLTTAIQSIFMYKKNAATLVGEGKISGPRSGQLFKLALIQDFTNPARLGLLIGALMAPVMGVIGSTESIVAGLTVIASGPISEWRFRKKLKRAFNPL